MGPAAFRKLALALPGSTEGAHQGHPDFRAGGRIFASLTADGRRGMVKLPLGEQRRLVGAHPGVFEPAPGAWGRAGATMVALARADAAAVKGALAAAHARAAERPARSRRAVGSHTAGSKRAQASPRARASGRRAAPKTVDDYLAGLRADQRAALERLRKLVRDAAPRAEECLSYGLPAFRQDGGVLLYLGAAAEHCAIYGEVGEGEDEELAGLDVGKGAIRFRPDEPLPAALVRKIVRRRMARNADARRAR